MISYAGGALCLFVPDTQELLVNVYPWVCGLENTEVWTDYWGLKFAAGLNEELIIILLKQGEAGKKLTVKMQKNSSWLFEIIWNYVMPCRATL